MSVSPSPAALLPSPLPSSLSPTRITQPTQQDVDGLRRMFLSADLQHRGERRRSPVLPLHCPTLRSVGRVREAPVVPSGLWNGSVLVDSTLRSTAVPPPRPAPKRHTPLAPLGAKVLEQTRRGLSPFHKYTGIADSRLATLRNSHPLCTTAQLLNYHSHVANLRDLRVHREAAKVEKKTGCVASPLRSRGCDSPARKKSVRILAHTDSNMTVPGQTHDVAGEPITPTRPTQITEDDENDTQSADEKGNVIEPLTYSLKREGEEDNPSGEEIGFENQNDGQIEAISSNSPSELQDESQSQPQPQPILNPESELQTNESGSNEVGLAKPEEVEEQLQEHVEEEEEEEEGKDTVADEDACSDIEEDAALDFAVEEEEDEEQEEGEVEEDLVEEE